MGDDQTRLVELMIGQVNEVLETASEDQRLQLEQLLSNLEAMRDNQHPQHGQSQSVTFDARAHFRDWLREELRALDFYNKWSDHYLIREFHRYAVEHGQNVDEASLGRYLRDDNPVLPSTERLRQLTRVLDDDRGVSALQLLFEAGLITMEALRDAKRIFKDNPVPETPEQMSNLLERDRLARMDERKKAAEK